MAGIDVSYTDETLNEAPADATRLLGAIGAEPSIRTSLHLAGMQDEDIIEGRNLLLACLAAPSASPIVTETEASRSQREAVVELDEWDEPNFARYQAALVRRFPAQARFVFDKLSAARGIDAVRGVATFKARVEALRDGSDPNRTATRKADRKAFEFFGSRSHNPVFRPPAVYHAGSQNGITTATVEGFFLGLYKILRQNAKSTAKSSDFSRADTKNVTIPFFFS